jgi:hypothetical protein
MGWLLLGMLAAVLLAVGLQPRERPPAAHWWVGLREHGREKSPVPAPDPFEVLRVQLRLGVLAEEVRSLECSGDVYARGHHLKATQAAYDALLTEACILAGISTSPSARPTIPQGEQERFREEVELASRGWSW